MVDKLVSFVISAFTATSILFLSSTADFTPYDYLKDTVIQLNNNCSGAVVDKDKRLVVTAAHCVEGEKVFKIEKIIFNPDGSISDKVFLNAEVAAVDKDADVAILRVGGGIKFESELKVSNLTPAIGSKIFTLGSPLGLEYVFSEGYIMDNKYEEKRFNQDYSWYLMDMLIGPGNSGGVAINELGEIVGLTNYKLASQATMTASTYSTLSAGKYIKRLLESIN